MTTYLPRNRGARFATWMLGVVALLAPFVIQGQSVQVQSRDSVDSATLQGSVRDSQGRAVAAASVYLRVEGGTQPLTAHTDSAGAFRFSDLGEGRLYPACRAGRIRRGNWHSLMRRLDNMNVRGRRFEPC